MKNIAIIGGGLSGVCCAYYLDKFSGINSKKFNIDLIEKDLEFAKNKFGKFQYGQEIYDNGWHGSVSEQGALFYLIIELGLHRYLMRSSDTKKVFYTTEGIKYLPEKMLYGYPLDKSELLLSDLFTFKEKLSILYNMHNTLEDENIQQLTVEKFFKENLNEHIYVKLIEPLLTSHYGSEVSQQNMVSLMPELSFLTIQREDINKILQEMFNRRVIDNITVGLEYRLKFTLKSFIETLESNFSDKVFLELNRKVEKIEKKGNKYLVYSNGSIYQYDYIVLTLNHNSFLPWFEKDLKVKEFYSKVKYTSNILVTFVLKREELHINREIGEVIFSKDASNYISKLEYASNKWIDIKMNKTDEEIKNMLEEEIKEVHGYVGEIERYYISRISNNYRFCDSYYNDNINKFTEYINETYPNLYIIGNSKKATNLENTILEAKETAKEILENIK